MAKPAQPLGLNVLNFILISSEVIEFIICFNLPYAMKLLAEET
jgi:hypothetical protein